MIRARVIAPIAAVVLLAGCSATPAVASKVDGTIIDEAAVTDASVGCDAVLDATANELRRDVVAVLTRGVIAVDLAKANGIDISQQTVESYLQQNQPALVNFYTNEDCGKVATAIGQFEIVGAAMGQQGVLAAVSEYDVELNPRYGNWDAANVTFAGSGSLSKAAAQS